MKGITQIFMPVAAVGLLALATIPSQAAPASKSSAPAQAALTTLIQNHNSPLPSGTRLLGVDIRNGLATVNFNRALTQGFQGGDSQAATPVNVILKTLGRFPTVNRVQILENGQTPGAMGGLIVLSSPLPVIRPQTTGQELYLHRRIAPQKANSH